MMGRRKIVPVFYLLILQGEKENASCLGQAPRPLWRWVLPQLVRQIGWPHHLAQAVVKLLAKTTHYAAAHAFI